MAVQTSYPGVYIDEFAPGAPIQGVATNIAALVGVARRGELNRPRRVTSWEAFLREYGDEPAEGFYLWYAARGFFENGGTVCYIVRVSNGTYGSLTLNDRAGQGLVRVRARQPGAIDIRVQVVERHDVSAANSTLYKPAGVVNTITNREITLNAGPNPGDIGGQFKPGDLVTIAAGGERLLVMSVSGDTLRVATTPVGGYGPNPQLRLADAEIGTRTVRIQTPVASVAALRAGAVLAIDPAGLNDAGVIESAQTEFLPNNQRSYRVTFRQGLRQVHSLAPAAATAVRSEEFDLRVQRGAAGTPRPYNGLSIDGAHDRYYLTVVNDDVDGLVTLEPVEPPPASALPQSLPANLAVTQLAAGNAENLAALGAPDFIRALDTLRQVDEVTLIAVPDAVRLAGAVPSQIHQAVIQQCEQLGDRFGVLDAEQNRQLAGNNTIEQQRNGLSSTRGYAALYYPWLRVRPFGAGDPLVVPPSGHVCGIIARSDSSRGVHKAPANELVNGAVGVQMPMSDVDQGLLNLAGINVLRVFSEGGRVVLWGARTTATDRNWQYVSTRRLFLFVEESIQEGIRWAVFEPNNLALWQKLRRSITDFLRQQWRDGALFGATPEEAFYVRIDDVLNPFSEQALGRLHLEIGLRPSYPAEFIIVHIGIWQGGSEVTES